MNRSDGGEFNDVKADLFLSSRKSCMALRAKGFTLLEIVLVIAILGLLLTVGITQVSRIFEDSSEAVARIFVNETVKTPLTTYRIHMGTYPTTDEGLQALVEPPDNDRRERWRGPYVDNVPRDPWGNPYRYRFPGQRNPGSYDIYSFGPDGVDSDQNIGNW